MTIVDLNVLLYAVNRNAPQHERARQWWEAALNGDETVGLTWVVILGFLRLSTSPRVFARPLSPTAALSKVDGWLARDVVRLVREKEEHWTAIKRVVGEAGTMANMTTDAHLAALALTYDAVLASSDRGFSRFPGLRWTNPLDE